MSSGREFLEQTIATLQLPSSGQAELVFFSQIVPHLQTANAASTHEAASDNTHALCMNPTDAFDLIESRRNISTPLFVSNDQAFTWRRERDPIQQLWDYFPSLQDRVEVFKDGDTLHTSLAKVCSRFEKEPSQPGQVSVLRLQSPLSTPVLPGFLCGPGASLLHNIVEILDMQSLEHNLSGQSLKGLKQGRSWIILSDGGLFTLPRIDNHGLATWIACQEGEVGLGWLHDPSEQQFETWLTEPTAFHNGEDWRFRVLHPNTTVYMEPVTVYFLFSPKSSGTKTFCLGGHVLRKAHMSKWAQELSNEVEHCKWSHSNEGRTIASPYYHALGLPETRRSSQALLKAAMQLIDTAQGEKRAVFFGIRQQIRKFREDASTLIAVMDQAFNGSDEIEGSDHDYLMYPKTEMSGFLPERPGTAADPTSSKNGCDSHSLLLDDHQEVISSAMRARDNKDDVIQETKSSERAKETTSQQVRERKQPSRLSRNLMPRYDDRTPMKELEAEIKREDRKKNLP